MDNSDSFSVQREWHYTVVENHVLKAEISPNAKLVYVILCMYANKTKECYPSLNTLCKDTGIKKRDTIIKALKELQDIGILEITKRKNENGSYNNNLYIIKDGVVHLMDKGSPLNGQGVVHLIDKGSPLNGHELEPINKNHINKNNIYAEQVQQVFDYYLETFQGFFKTYTLTRDRRTKIEARLKEGYTVEQIKTAISNIRQSPFHCGENDRNKFYADITFICRSGSKLEEWINYQPPIHKEEETPTIWRRKLL